MTFPHGSTAGLITVRPTMPAIEVLELMCRLKVSGVGVTGRGSQSFSSRLNVCTVFEIYNEVITYVRLMFQLQRPQTLN
jgi:hypothetical protein